jgi:hypothetical protein
MEHKVVGAICGLESIKPCSIGPRMVGTGISYQVHGQCQRWSLALEFRRTVEGWVFLYSRSKIILRSRHGNLKCAHGSLGKAEFWDSRLPSITEHTR